MKILTWYKYQQILEEFEEAKIKRPGFFTKLGKKFKDFSGIESIKDRELFDRIRTTILDSNSQHHVDGIREISDTAITARIMGGQLVVDSNPEEPEISWRGRNLDLNDLDISAEYLYNILKDRIVE